MLIFNSKLATRVILGLAMIIGFTGLLAGDGWAANHAYFFLTPAFDGAGFTLLASFFIIAGCVEYFHICRAKGFQPSLAIMIAGSLLIIWQPYWKHILGDGAESSLAVTVLAVILATGCVLVARGQTGGAIAGLAATGFGVIYLGFGGLFWVKLRFPACGFEGVWDRIQYLVMFLACVKSSDIGAYFAGRFLGRHKWVPLVSPGKTWEGLAGAVIFAMIVASLFARISGIMNVSYALLFGAVLALSGQLGDLVESLLKRDAGLKDSAPRISQFGGVLDMIDSLLLAGPWAYGMIVMQPNPPM
jgi:phosphatidate cytidylyltransferase